MLFYDIMSGDFLFVGFSFCWIFFLLDFLFAGYLENNLEKNPFFFAFSGTFCAF